MLNAIVLYRNCFESCRLVARKKLTLFHDVSICMFGRHTTLVLKPWIEAALPPKDTALPDSPDVSSEEAKKAEAGKKAQREVLVPNQKVKPEDNVFCGRHIQWHR